MEGEDVERPATKIAEFYDWRAIKIRLSNKRGWPDHLYMKDGVFVFVEYKSGNKWPTAQQEKRHRELRESGAMVVVIWDAEVAGNIFRKPVARVPAEVRRLNNEYAKKRRLDRHANGEDRIDGDRMQRTAADRRD